MTVVLATLGLQVRAFQAADAGFVSRLGKDAFCEYSEEPGVSTLWMAKHYRTFVATLDGRSVGFAIMHLKAAKMPELVAIAVVKSARGRGVGRRLLATAERMALLRGARSLRLHTADFNLAALELFLNCGFRITRRYRRYYRDRFAACELVKDL